MKNTSDNRNNTCKILWEFPPVYPDNFFSTMSKFNHGAKYNMWKTAGGGQKGNLTSFFF